jgi:hypothetical protein
MTPNEPAGGGGRPAPATADEPMLAPGYQGTLLPAPVTGQPRWRAVQPDGTRLPPVSQLGVVIAQATAIAGERGAAWIVGPGEHTIQVTRAGATLHTTAAAAGPRWTATVRGVIDRANPPGA